MMNTTDLYLVFPCNREQRAAACVAEPSNLAQSFLDELSQHSKYEFDSAWASCIERRNFGNIELVIKNDDRDSPEIIDTKAAFCTESHFAGSELSLFYVVVPQITEYLTFILDQSSRREVSIRVDGKDFLLEEWLKDFGLNVTGKAYYTVSTSGLDENEAANIISAEAYYTDNTILINSKDVKRILNENIAQYTYYDCFVSKYGVMYVLKEFDADYCNRLYSECLLMFIVEIIVLKISAIQLANNQVIKQLSNKNITPVDMLEISEKFSTSIHLWDTQHFRYFISQTFANHVERAFGIDYFLEQYDRNRRLLEQLNNIRSIIVSEKESKMFNIFGTVLAIMQVAPMIYAISLSVSEIHDITLGQWIAFGLSGVLSIFTAFFIFRKNRL